MIWFPSQHTPPATRAYWDARPIDVAYGPPPAPLVAVPVTHGRPAGIEEILTAEGDPDAWGLLAYRNNGGVDRG